MMLRFGNNAVIFNRQGKLYILVFIIHLFILSAITSFALAFPSPSEEHLKALCIATLIVVAWSSATLSFVHRDVFNLYSLFFTSLVIFNAGRIILEVFDLNDQGMLWPLVAGETWPASVMLVLAGITGYHMGGLICALRYQNVLPAANNLIQLKMTRRVGGVILLLSAIPLLVVTLQDVKTVIADGYFGLFSRERLYGVDAGIANVLKNLAAFAVGGLLFLLAGLSNSKTKSKQVYVLILVYGLVQLFLGRRSWGLMSILGATWLWHSVVRPVPLKKIAPYGIAVFVFVLPTVKAFRGETGADRLSVNRLVESFSSIENPLVAILSEMGGSINTVAVTLENIPQHKPYMYGSSYLFALTGLIPNFFWPVHPSVEHGSLARWLVMTEFPVLWEAGGGYGFSCIAEAYANFGRLGSMMVMMWVGYLMARLGVWANNGTPPAKAVIAICIAYVLFWARGDVTLFIRPIFYGAVVPYWLIMAAVRWIRTRNSELIGNELS
jgi:oligosaccharide repeat unit polymerase